MGDLTAQQQKVSILLKKSPLIISGPCSAETEEQGAFFVGCLGSFGFAIAS